MVQFIGVEQLASLVRRVGIRSFNIRLAAALREDFLRWHAFDKTARHASHSASGVIELMPISDGERYAFKFVNGHPGNTALGKSTVTAFGVLADVATGFPLLLSELTLTTALRTAATSALAALAMARRDSRVMALIGNGAQAEFQALAFHHLLGIDTIRAFDVDPAATAKLARNLARVPGLAFIACATAREAAHGADIVTTATADKTRAAILTSDMIAPGVHLNAIGGDCPGKTELAADLVARSRVVVEYTPQTRVEGEIQQLAPDFPVIELWEVVSGNTPGRVAANEVTLFDSVGFALEDFSALRLLHELVRGEGATMIDLVPDGGDPKDLFGRIGTGAALPRLRNAA